MFFEVFEGLEEAAFFYYKNEKVRAFRAMRISWRFVG